MTVTVQPFAIYRECRTVVAYPSGQEGIKLAEQAFYELLFRHWQPSVFHLDRELRLIPLEDVTGLIERLVPRDLPYGLMVICDPMTFEVLETVDADVFHARFHPVSGSKAWFYETAGRDHMAASAEEETTVRDDDGYGITTTRSYLVDHDKREIEDPVEFARGKIRIVGETSMLADAPLAVQTLLAFDLKDNEQAQATHLQHLAIMAKFGRRNRLGQSPRANADTLMWQKLLEHGNSFLFTEGKPTASRIMLDLELANQVYVAAKKITKNKFPANYCTRLGLPLSLFEPESSDYPGCRTIREREMKALSGIAGRDLSVPAHASLTSVLLPGLDEVYGHTGSVERHMEIMNQFSPGSLIDHIENDKRVLVFDHEGERVLMTMHKEGKADIAAWPIS